MNFGSIKNKQFISKAHKLVSGFLVFIFAFTLIFSSPTSQVEASYVQEPANISGPFVTNDTGGSTANNTATITGTVNGAAVFGATIGDCGSARPAFEYSGPISMSVSGTTIVSQSSNFTTGSSFSCDLGPPMVRASGTFSITVNVSSRPNGSHSFPITFTTLNQGPPLCQSPIPSCVPPNSVTTITASVNVLHPTCTITIKGRLNPDGANQSFSPIPSTDYLIYGPIISGPVAQSNGDQVYTGSPDSTYIVTLSGNSRTINGWSSVPLSAVGGSCNAGNGQADEGYVNFQTKAKLQAQ
jgi:hypothetical protein